MYHKIICGGILNSGYDYLILSLGSPFPILLAIPAVPAIGVSVGVISETPVSQSNTISIPAVPAIGVSVGVISETPVSQSNTISIPAVPSVSVSTSVT